MAPEIEVFPPALNSERNKLSQSDRAFHDWYRFVLSYPPHLVREYLEEFRVKENNLVLDPFCGTGTTVVEAKIRGFESVGLEANRFAHFAGSVKSDWKVDPKALREQAAIIKESVLSKLARHGISDQPKEHLYVPKKLRTLNDDQTRILLKDSISPLPLHKALVLRDEINTFRNTTLGKYFNIALAKSLVFHISNLRFGPEVGIGKIKEDSVVVEAWFREISKIADDIESVNTAEFPSAKVVLSDSRSPFNFLDGRKFTAVITSPPYPNEKDYTRTTRLESVILGFVSNRQDLREMKKTLLRSNTRGVYKNDEDDKYVNNIPEIQQIAKKIEERRVELGKTSGFERMYARVTKLYFGGMATHLEQLKESLAPGAQLAYVVGDQASYLRVMIRTGNILAKVAESVGYEVVRIDQFRTRFSTATQTDLNEEVLILRYRGK